MEGSTTIRQTRLSLKQLIAAGAVAVAAIIGSAVVGLQTDAAPPSTVTVTPANESSQKWFRTESGGGTLSYVNSSGAMGSGALQFVTPETSSYVRFRNNIKNVNLADITTASYMTKQIMGTQNTAAVNMRLYIDTSGDGVFDDTLVYEPYYNDVLKTNQWQTWDVSQTEGKWWSNMGMTYNGKGGGGAGSYETNFTLSDVVAEYPSATVDEIGLGTGDGNSPWVVQADAFKVNSTTYDFEPTKSSNNPTTKDQCKNDNWSNLVDSTGATFKNQGACVSYNTSSDRANKR